MANSLMMISFDVVVDDHILHVSPILIKWHKFSSCVDPNVYEASNVENILDIIINYYIQNFWSFD